MRIPGWEARLDLAVEQYRRRPFAWGQADCLLWPASVVEALTGKDPAAEYRGAYSEARGARRLLRNLGVRSGPQLVAGMFAEVGVAHAWRGDIAVIEHPSDQDPFGALGIVLGPHLAGYGQSGLAFVPRSAAKLTFRVE